MKVQAGTQRVDEFIACIRETNELLQREPDLSPANEQVADMIGRLMKQLRARYTPEEISAVLDNEYVAMHRRSLQDKLSEAEFLSELSEAQRMCQSRASVPDAIASQPIWRVYMALVGEELAVLRKIAAMRDEDSANRPVVFVGSGPMPLSAAIVHGCGGMEVVCVEIDPEACETSRIWLERMGLASKVKVVLANGSAFDYSPYDRIFVASLVRNKSAVLERIGRTSPASILAVRTAEGMRQIMYEAIDESLLQKRGWTIAARTQPDEKLVINSTLFLEQSVK